MADVTLPTLPHALRWTREPQAWRIDPDQRLQITAGPKTDLFIDPTGDQPLLNAPTLMFTPDPLWTFSARVSVQFASTFDAGVLFLYAAPTCWAKLCFEFSPQGQPMIVSVVTNTRSDDCNSVTLDTMDVYLRITRLGQAFAFHYSRDGRLWHMVRYFALNDVDKLEVGFEAQSPTGEACTATFSEISYRAEAVADIRSGV